MTLAARARAASVQRRALAAVVGAVLFWSASSLFVRAAHSDAAVFTTYRLWFALPPLAVIVWMRSRRPNAPVMWPVDGSLGRWVLLMFGAGAFFVLGAATAFAAIGRTRLLDVTLIGALEPALIVAIAVAFLAERVTVGHVVRSLIAIVGTFVVALAASSSGHWSLSGEVIAVVSLVFNTGWFLYGRVLRKRYAIDPFAFMLATLSAGAVILTPVAAVAHGGLAISGRGMLFAACTMVSGTSAHVLMIWAHRYVPSATSSMLLLAEPPVVAVGAWICFGESVGIVAALASLVVVASLVGVVRSPQFDEVEDEAVDPGPPS